MVVWKHLAGLAGIALSVAGCTAEVSSDENTAEISQEYWIAHSEAVPWGDQVVGMLFAPVAGMPFIYYDDGTACRMPTTRWWNGNVPLCDTWFTYSAPNSDWGAIRGIDWNPVRGRTATWYSDSTTSEGNSVSLTLYYNKQTFSRPLKPNGGTFSMNELIEVAIPCWEGVCRHHYYWKNSTDGLVYRTVGTRVDGDAYNAAALVSTAMDEHGPIRGIATWEVTQSNPFWMTWYQDGMQNRSGSQYALDE